MIKKIFLTGLITLLPIAITLFTLFFFFDLITAPFAGLTKQILTAYDFHLNDSHHWLFTIISRLLAFVLLIVFIFLLGLLGQRFILSPLIKTIRALLNKIPMIKTMYRILEDITKNALSEERKKLFKGTALVPFPDNNTRALGLLSGVLPKAMIEKEKSDERLQGKELQSVFIPTSPHPISGFLVMYAKQDTQYVDITTEDLFKFLLSCGVFEPKQKESDEKK